MNAWIYETYRDRPWPGVYRDWRAGFRRLLDLGEAVPEDDLLPVGNYPWLPEYPLSLILTASADHHEEHLESLPPRLATHLDV